MLRVFRTIFRVGTYSYYCSYRSATALSQLTHRQNTSFTDPSGPLEAWMSVCCVLSGRGLCDGPIIRPEESYQELSYRGQYHMLHVYNCILLKMST